MENLKVFTAFSGYDSQCMALDRIMKENKDFNYELVGWSEIDKYAIQAHNAVYPQWSKRNYGDICKIDWNEVPDFDLFTYSSPCQDFSASGKQAGGEKGSGTRSSLLWECERAIEIKRPKYLLMENVAALVSKKFIGLFNNWQHVLEGYGYTNFPMVLNAKDYGVPQNRKRVFLLSVLDGDIDFKTPQPIKLEKLLKDVLEDNVDDKYYLSKKLMEGFDRHKAKSKELGRGFGWQPTDGNVVAHAVLASGAVRPCDNFVIDKTVLGWTRDKEGKIVNRHPVDVANCVTAMRATNTQNYVVEPINTDADGCARTIGTQYPSMNLESVTSKSRDGYGYIRTAVMEYKGKDIHEGDGLYLNTTEAFFRGGLEGVSRTLKANVHDAGCNDGYGIRKLTPRECFRLMDCTDEDIDKILSSGVSMTQQYKMAGNSIVVSCLYHIFKNLFVKDEESSQQGSLF